MSDHTPRLPVPDQLNTAGLRRNRQFQDWLREDMHRYHAMTWLLGIEEYAPDEDGNPHPTYPTENFFVSLRGAYLQWGRLTTRQFDRVLENFTALDRIAKLPDSDGAARTAGVGLGVVGDPIRLQLVYKRSVPYGQGVLVIFNDRDFNEVVNFRKHDDVPRHSALTVEAKVTEHKMFRGRMQTVLEDLKVMKQRKRRIVG